jgi:hypothetical protein
MSDIGARLWLACGLTEVSSIQWTDPPIGEPSISQDRERGGGRVAHLNETLWIGNIHPCQQSKLSNLIIKINCVKYGRLYGCIEPEHCVLRVLLMLGAQVYRTQKLTECGQERNKRAHARLSYVFQRLQCILAFESRTSDSRVVPLPTGRVVGSSTCRGVTMALSARCSVRPVVPVATRTV